MKNSAKLYGLVESKNRPGVSASDVLRLKKILLKYIWLESSFTLSPSLWAIAMSVERRNIQNNPNVGVFVLATESFALVPSGVAKPFLESVKANLKVEIYVLNTFSRVLGVLAAANSHGIVLSSIASKEDVEYLSNTTGLEVQRLTSQFYALGNTIAANDYAAVCSPFLDEKSTQTIEEVLKVPIRRYRFKFSELMGSLTVTTNSGCLVSPEATDKEVDQIKELLQVKTAKIGTVNRGQTFVAAGMIASSHGCICGEETTGLEIMRISETLIEST
jgi:translation initiation factor 6